MFHKQHSYRKLNINSQYHTAKLSNPIGFVHLTLSSVKADAASPKHTQQIYLGVSPTEIKAYNCSGTFWGSIRIRRVPILDGNQKAPKLL